jgi:hypothetical protein
MKLSVKEIKALSREVIFNGWEDKMWKGKSNGLIHDGLYLEVYMANYLATSSKEKDHYKACELVRIPLTRVYRF